MGIRVITMDTRAKLKKRIATLTKRRKRWIEKRDRLLLKWAFEGIDVRFNNMHKLLYAWEIDHTAAQIETLRAYLDKEGV